MAFIPDSGLNNFGSKGFAAASDFVQYLAIGSGGGTHSQSSTGLFNETQRGNSNGGFTDSTTYSVVGNDLILTHVRTRVLDITSAVNATEFMFIDVSSGGSPSIIDNFRADPDNTGSSPVTLSLDVDDQLQVILTYTITLPRVINTADSITIVGTDGNDLSGTFDVDQTWYADSGDESNAFRVFNPTQILSSDSNTNNPALGLMDATGATSPGLTDTPSCSDFVRATEVTATLEAYTAGTFYRDKTILIKTSAGNGTIYGFVFGYDAAALDGGYWVKFTDPTTLTKTSSDRLSVTLRVSWDRA